jgi:hypothetical protein
MKRVILTLFVASTCGCGSNSHPTAPNAPAVVQQPQGQAIVSLNVSNVNGGNAIASDFLIRIVSQTTNQVQVAQATSTVTALQLAPDSYKIDVKPQVPDGYTSVGCIANVLQNSTTPCQVKVDEVVQTCDLSLYKFVYNDDNDDRLKKVFAGTSCMSMTGIVQASESGDDNADSDLVADFALDPDYTKFLNNFNLLPKSAKGNDGNMVAEAICQGTLKLDIVKKSCANFTGARLILPPSGTHVKITGIVVTDQIHGWRELHPITSIIVLPH